MLSLIVACSLGHSAPKVQLHLESAQATAPAASEPCADYAFVNCEGTPCRIPAANLPLHVYSQDPGREALVRQAAAVWNEASHRFQNRDVVVVDAAPTPGSVAIDWTGRDVPAKAVAATPMEQHGPRLEVERICMRTDNAEQANLAHTLTHEMGHALGMDHSKNPDDVMFRAVHKGAKAALSQRDYQMFHWLYTRPQTVPIVVVSPSA